MKLNSSNEFEFFFRQALDIPEHLRAPLKLIRKACIDESHVDEKYIDASKNGYLPDVPELKCYILCLFELGGVIDTDNSIDFDKVMHLLPASIRETLDHVVKTCGTISINALFEFHVLFVFFSVLCSIFDLNVHLLQSILIVRLFRCTDQM